jgi:phosphoesterase RecJ-like protein
MQNAFEQFRQIVDRCTKFVITTHVNPDPDAIGSEIALARYLTQAGKIVGILNHSATPANCAFLDPQGLILQFDPILHANIILSADAIVVVDANQPERMQSLKPYVLSSPATKVCIDHHLDRAPFADLYVIDEDSSATGEILYDLFTTLQPESVTPEIALPLYVAIMTDTGSFRFPKTDATLHRIVAELLDRGVDPAQAYHKIHEQGTANRLQLLGNVLTTLQLAHEGRVAYMTLTREMFSRTGTTEEDAENFINHTLTIAGVQVGLMFSELADGLKVSFRSRGDIAINKLAQEFGGNGHKNAAGTRIVSGNLGSVMPQVLERVKDYLL